MDWKHWFKDFWRYPTCNSGNSRQVHTNMKVIKLRGLQASQMDLNTPVSDFHFWVHELLMSLTWASGECPGQAKFESFLPKWQAGIQIFFEPCLVLLIGCTLLKFNWKIVSKTHAEQLPAHNNWSFFKFLIQEKQILFFLYGNQELCF